MSNPTGDALAALSKQTLSTEEHEQAQAIKLVKKLLQAHLKQSQSSRDEFS